jgi:hypothetical protein
VVPHRSTNQARTCLTSLSRREAVLSCWYGRSRCGLSSITTVSYYGIYVQQTTLPYQVPILVPGTSLAVLVRIRSKIAYGQTVVGCSHVASSTKRTYFHRYSSVPLVLVSLPVSQVTECQKFKKARPYGRSSKPVFRADSRGGAN